MPKEYYQHPSPLGKPILDLFLDESDYKESCIHTIWHLEDTDRGSFNQYNAIKYIWRLGQKDPDYRDDLDKAIEYWSWEIEKVAQLRTEIIENSSPLAIEAAKNANLAIEILELAIDKCKELYPC
jgi:Protein of unknwon function (DUF3310)